MLGKLRVELVGGLKSVLIELEERSNCVVKKRFAEFRLRVVGLEIHNISEIINL